MGLAASGQLIDRHAAFFLPGARGDNRGGIGGVLRECVANLLAAADQLVESGDKTLDLRFEAFRHARCLSGMASKSPGQDVPAERNGKDTLQKCKDSVLDSLWRRC